MWTLEYNGIMWQIVVRIIWSSILIHLTYLTHTSSRVPVIKKMNNLLTFNKISTFVSPFWKTNLCLHVFIIQFLLDLSSSFLHVNRLKYQLLGNWYTETSNQFSYSNVKIYQSSWFIFKSLFFSHWPNLVEMKANKSR